MRLRIAATSARICLWLVRAWVQIPFVAIFAEIPQSCFKLLTFHLLFSHNIVWFKFLLKIIMFLNTYKVSVCFQGLLFRRPLPLASPIMPTLDGD